MVANATSTNSRKRKQLDDMEESPPKRVTRARAAKVNDEPKKPATKSTKITTASARVAAEAKKATATKAAAKPTKTTLAKRRTRADDTATTAEVGVEEMTKKDDKPVERPARATSTRGRKPKIVETEATQDPAPATTSRARTRQVKVAVESEVATEELKPKGRPRKTTKDASDEPVQAQLDEKPEPVKRSTRGRPPATTKAASTRATTRTTTKPVTTRKRVTFQDEPEEDKENIPVVMEGEKKQAVKATGIKAKPVRKPAATRGTTRGRRAAATKSEDSGESQVDSQPLSPKKVTQVSKGTGSSSSEDELGQTSPVRPLHKSPMKPQNLMKSPFKELPKSPFIQLPKDELSASLELSPSASAAIAVNMTSPARRPPPSPLKDVLKESPKKFDFTPSVKQPVFKASTETPLKASLLQSPARRPMSSFKSVAPVRSNKIQFPGPLSASKAIRFTTSSSQRMISSPLRAMNSTVKVNKMPPTEQEPVVEQDDSPSPIKPILEDPFAEESMDSPLPLASEPAVMASPAFDDASPKFRDTHDSFDSDSEDELQSGNITMTSPVRKFKQAADLLITKDTPSRIISPLKSAMKTSATPAEVKASDFTMTPLAVQLSSWLASSPVKKDANENYAPTRGIFTPVGATRFGRPNEHSLEPSPEKPTFFEDQLAVQGTEPVEILVDEDLHDAVDAIDAMEIDTIAPAEEFQESESQEYGDENAMPVDPLMLFKPQSSKENVATPVRKINAGPRVVHTVCKVPLKAADDDTLLLPRKRSKSMSGPVDDSQEVERPNIARSNTVISYSLEDIPDNRPKMAESPKRSVSWDMPVEPPAPATPANGSWSALASPLRSVRKGADAQILRGAVVYVDVHTSEGADASGIFMELLTAMGARCVKQWTWSPRGSTRNTPSAGENTPAGKVGITHVVFKDGGKRTLQKVREAKGLVLCVGVGWVLE